MSRDRIPVPAGGSPANGGSSAHAAGVDTGRRWGGSNQSFVRQTEVVMRRSYHRAGLVVLAVLSLLDLLGPLLTAGSHPPMSVALVGAAIGLASLALVPPAWRGSKRAAWVLVGLRLLSALSAVPAFFVSDAPAAAV